jgi:hypothetical protein
MKFIGAVVKEQGVTFALVSVKQHIVNNPVEASELIAKLTPTFGGVPVILVALSKRSKFYGRTDIVRFLANVPLHAIPWREYHLR